MNARIEMICMYACMSVCMYADRLLSRAARHPFVLLVCMHACMHACMYACECMHIDDFIHKHIHRINVHTYMHT